MIHISASIRLNSFRSNTNRIFRRNHSLKANLYVWGDGERGELGLNNWKSYKTPQKVELPNSCDVFNINFGVKHTALKCKNGDIYMTGSNLNNQLGLGDNAPERINTFTKIPDLPPMKQVACGNKHTVALSSEGQVYSWGFPGTLFSVGALGHDNKAKSSSPCKIKHADKITSIAAGSQHSLALTASGQVLSWGSSELGVLGNTGVTSFIKNGVVPPRRVEYFSKLNIVKIKACNSINAAITNNNDLYMWGRNDRNQLGVENINIDIQSCENMPRPVTKDYKNNELKIQDLCLSSLRCVAMSLDKRYYQWGQIFVWPTLYEMNIDRIKSVGVGHNYQTILTENGRFFIWGNNKNILNAKRTMVPVEIDFFKKFHVLKVFTGENRIAVLVKNK